MFVAFEEHKPINFDLWLSGVGCPVHGYLQKNSLFCKVALSFQYL